MHSINNQNEDKNKKSQDITSLKSSNSKFTSFRNTRELQNEIHTHSKISFRGQLKKTIIYFIAVLLFTWIFIFVGRSLYDSLLYRIDKNKVVHKDKTKIYSGVKSETNNQLILIYKNEHGEVKRVAADKSSLTKFAKIHLPILEEKRIEIRKRSREYIFEDNKEIFKSIYNRIPEYADWYFAYTTTYKILGKAISSSTAHTLEPNAIPLLDAVSLDVEKYIEEHFNKIVLKPEISDPKFQQNYQKNFKDAHIQFLSVMANLSSEFQKFISEKTDHLDNFNENKIEMEIDWASQFNKVSMAGYEKGTGGAVVGAGLTVGGALTGKAIGGAFGKAAVGKVLASSGGKSLIAKISAPFVGKAVSLAGSAAAGGTVGTVAGGPVGTVVGAGVGVLVDYAINEGVELANRDTFEQDTRLAIESFEIELNNKESISLEQAVDIWFGDAINLLETFN